ncbi:histone-lysine N-methyltransferase SETMAR-like isoform X1 [Oratosquilla oratoria]|uniref:histone-lysine N-methyltransferase SETMAR-like isoform X1 n=1 Tax=Oratosquilla oratoria TaxID=337810 RepID=UPI003F7729BD
MPPLIENVTDCEICTVICFLTAKGMKAAKIHYQISEVYGENIMSDGMVQKWVRAFKDGMLSKEIILLHDNSRPHIANQTQDVIRSFGWEQLDHPLYSPDIAPNDYHIFLHLKKHLGGQCHDDDEDVKTAMLQWYSYQAADFYEEGTDWRSHPGSGCPQYQYSRTAISRTTDQPLRTGTQPPHSSH